MGEARRRKLQGLGPCGEESNHSAIRRINDKAAMRELKGLIETQAKETAAHTIPEGTVADVVKVVQASEKK